LIRLTNIKSLKAVSIALVVKLIAFDVSYGYPLEQGAGRASLATPSALQAHDVTVHEALVVVSVARYLLGDERAGIKPQPAKYLRSTLSAELGDSLKGFDLDSVTVKDGVVSIRCNLSGREAVYEAVSERRFLKPAVAGPEWFLSENFIIRRTAEIASKPARGPPAGGAGSAIAGAPGTGTLFVKDGVPGLWLKHSGTSANPIRVVLIMPRSILQKVKPTRFPIGIMSIASCLRDKEFLLKLAERTPGLESIKSPDIPNVEVRIIDLQAENDDFDLSAALAEIDPDIVGISAVTQLFSSAGNVSKIAASAAPAAIRMIGGVHISAISERVSSELESAMADYRFQIAVIREGEEAVGEAMLRLANHMDILEVPGLVVKESDTSPVRRTADRREAPRRISVDEYPIPGRAIDLINVDGYEKMVDVHGVNKGVAGSLMTSRGCPFGCIFCASKAVFSRRVDHVSAERVFEELKYYNDRGFRGFYIMDDNFCLDGRKVKALADLVETSGIDVSFSAFAHANFITPEVARDLRRAGCAVIALGVESGDETLLERVGKKTSTEKIALATKALQDAGVRVKFFLLTGLPGQDWPSIRKTAELIVKCRPNAIDVAVTTPYPGSALYGSAEIKVAKGASFDQLVHIVEPQLKATAAVDVHTYTDVMTSEEIARSRDLLNALFRNIDDTDTIERIVREIDERSRENAQGGYPETDIVRARRAAREACALKGSKHRLNDALQKERDCFESIRRAIGTAIRQMSTAPGRVRLEDVEVVATAPVRMDIASGRGSDLFVSSMERGGKVLNAAITLNGSRPISVTVRTIPQYEIRINSADLNREEVVTKAEQLDISETSITEDPLRLYKAALIEAGIVPETFRGDLDGLLRSLGGGLEITGRVDNVPAGSGLGISSILGITLIRALYEVTGRTPDDSELIMKAVSLEHRLGSYGGWQDPVGGAFGGIKWITAEAGNPVPRVTKLDLPAETLAELQSRIVLYYTGKQHFAGDILGKIITGYLLREEPCYGSMVEAQALRDRMLAALRAGDLDGFGSLAGKYWKATVSQTGGEATNDAIDKVFSDTADLVEGGKASGAGGGGFFFFIAKKDKARELKERLEKMSGAAKGKVYNFAFDDEGIRITKRKGSRAIAVSEGGTISPEDRARLRSAVSGYFSAVESAPGHEPLNYLYDSINEPADIGGGLFCDIVLNTGRYGYEKKVQPVAAAARPQETAARDVMIGHGPTQGMDGCFLCGVKDPEVIARLRFRGDEYLLIANENPNSPENMLLFPAAPEPQRATGAFVTLFAGVVNALGDEYEGVYNEPFAAASVYHRHGHIRKGRASIMRNSDDSLRPVPVRNFGPTRVSELAAWPATAYLIESPDAASLGGAFGVILDGFHAENVSSNFNICYVNGRPRAVYFPRLPGNEKPKSLCPEHPALYGRFGGLEAGGWFNFLSRESFDFMLDLARRAPGEFRKRIKAALAEVTLRRSEASRIMRSLPMDAPAASEADSRELEDSERAFGSLIVLARKAKREGQKLIIGLETEWIPAINDKRSLQSAAVGGLLQDIEAIGAELEAMGHDNVEVVRGGSGSLAGAVLGEAGRTQTNMRNIVIIASAATIYSESFAPFRSADTGDRPFLAGVDPAELVKLYGRFGESPTGQLHVALKDILMLTVWLASGKEPPKLPMIVSYDKNLRLVIFMPKAEPMDYEKLKSTYMAERAALAAA
jgi:galactokinase/mevalonate kinase-like predicted kinase/radical SAM superfamily enzyme YgiQ (UPF0313 family)